MPGIFVLFAAAALLVKPDGAELRESCDVAEPVVAKLAAGTPARIRFAINGCYAVEVEQNGKVLQGFLPGDRVEGATEWELERRAARPVDAPVSRQQSGTQSSTDFVSPVTLLRENRPAEALAVAERALLSAPRDPQLLLLAGVAAHRNDMAVRAIGYLKDSLALRPDATAQRLLEQVEREQSADKSGEPLHSPRFVFRFDPAMVPREKARSLLGLLEQEFSRIAFTLGCSPAERIAVIVQSREDYFRTTGAAEWSGGQFDGRIRVALLEPDPAGPVTRRALAHEAVHACLAAAGRWPAWLHEGLAQRLSGETLSDARRHAVKTAVQGADWPGLGGLSQDWSRMSSGHAALAYAASLYAVELYEQHHAAYGIRNLLRVPEQLPAVIADLDKRMRAVEPSGK